jgi:beta-glucosidase
MTNYNNSAERALVSRAIAREGIILLENKNNTLPLGQEPVAVFGRTQIDMIQGGTGSALCTSEYCVNILTGLENAGVQVDQELADIYRKWCSDNPLVSFGVWGSGAHVNPEMPLWEDVVARASARTEKAIFVIGRTAGENDDVNVMDGDFRLSSEEKAAYEMVCKHFSNIIVVINSGNLIDLRFTQRAEVKAVVLLNLPGMEGGNALGDVLSGKFTPSGKLTDTVAYEYSDYPSSKYFGKKGGIIQNYNEDIFVGYRYFETFEHAKDKVMYPFGYGLSYTQFESRALSFTYDDSIDGMVKAEIAVKNIGNTYSGKEVIMLYSSAPKSKLGAPAYELRAFQKTRLLAPGEEEILTLTFPIQDMASFDDTGVLGTANAWVLMQGAYSVFFGNNVKTVQKLGEYEVAADTVLKTCTALPTELTSRLTSTGEMETLDAIPQNTDNGILLDAIEENIIAADKYFAKEENTITYRLDVPAPGVYRAKFIGLASDVDCTLNKRPLDNLAECLGEKGDDIILVIGVND